MTQWLASLRLVLSISLVLAFAGGLVDPAVADEVPFDCTILPGDVITNPLAADASCIVTCKFSTTATPVDCKS